MNSHKVNTVCSQLAMPVGSASYYRFRYVEEDKRQALAALYAWRYEVTAIARQCTDAQVALAKLNWWHNETRNVFNSQPTHPIAIALQHAVRKFELHSQRFQNVLNAIESDLTAEGYQTDAELINFFHHCYGEIEMLASTILGYQDLSTLDYARDLGIGLQLLDSVVHLQPDLKAGLVYLSAENLQAQQVSQEALHQLKLTVHLQAAIKHQLNLAELYFQQAETQLPKVDKKAQESGLIMLNIQRALYAAIREENYNVITQAIQLTPLRMWWLARRA